MFSVLSNGDGGDGGFGNRFDGSAVNGVSVVDGASGWTDVLGGRPSFGRTAGAAGESG